MRKIIRKLNEKFNKQKKTEGKSKTRKKKIGVKFLKTKKRSVCVLFVFNEILGLLSLKIKFFFFLKNIINFNKG